MQGGFQKPWFVGSLRLYTINPFPHSLYHLRMCTGFLADAAVEFRGASPDHQRLPRSSSRCSPSHGQERASLSI